jgi:two-component system phosphate regulon sensor histidine kinase PhoR
LRFLLRHSLFILFPLMLLALFVLARIAFGAALSFGEWGERSIAESTLLVAKQKLDRAEHVVATTDDAVLSAINPTSPHEACDRWRRMARFTPLVAIAAVIDDHSEIVSWYYRHNDESRTATWLGTLRQHVIPEVDIHASHYAYKHLHKALGSGYVFATYLTTTFDNRAYTAIILYDSDELVGSLLTALVEDVGEDRVANIVDDQNRLIVGQSIDGAGEYVVSRRFPSTLYKWRLQVAMKAAALFASKASARWFSEVLLVPATVALIAFGFVVLGLAVVRERRLNRLQSEFIANVSHELKTPLSLIRMYGELLLMGSVKDGAKAKRYHEVILRETERLTGLIDNVLNLARIERGKGVYEFETVSPGEVVERSVELARHRLAQAGFGLELSIKDSLPLVVVDEHAIALAIVNLVDNAAKYASGTDLVGVEVYSKDPWVCIDVFDHGTGIPREHLRRVFERFYRVPSATKQARGSGIGLSLVKQIAEAHGGHVLVTSHPRIETRFSIRIPVASTESGTRHG